jgi:hypothetical protein
MDTPLHITDELHVSAGYRAAPAGRIGLHGHLRVWHQDGTLMVDQHNTIVTAGLEALVDALVGAAYVNTFKYVGFGIAVDATEATDIALGTELSGGTYARLTGTQGEGATSVVYRVSGTWTNNSSSNPATVTEYGLFSDATEGTMLSRVSTGDASPPASKQVATNETITVQWDFTLADA